MTGLHVMWTRIDLHLHTTASDGKGAPADVVRVAAARGVGLLAITDHHTLDGYATARRAGTAAGVVVLPGVELDCVSGRNGVHLLALFRPRRGVAARVTAELGLE